MRTVEQRTRYAADRRARYHGRKESEKCVRCGAVLQPEDDTLECSPCADARSDVQRAYYTSAKGRATRAAIMRRWRARRREDAS